MKVKRITDGKVLTVNDSYGTRLIEQGAATLVKEKAKTSTKGKAARKKDDHVTAG